MKHNHVVAILKCGLRCYPLAPSRCDPKITININDEDIRTIPHRNLVCLIMKSKNVTIKCTGNRVVNLHFSAGDILRTR